MKKTDKTNERNVVDIVLTYNSSQLVRNQITEMIKKPLITNSDFSLLFKIDFRTCYRWRECGEINYIRMRRRIYYYWVDVLKLMESRLSNSAGDGSKDL